jgi:hypothetical protein
VRYRGTFDPRKGETVSWVIGISRRCIATHFGAHAEVAADLPARRRRGISSTIRSGGWSSGARSRRSTPARELVALRYGPDMTAKQIA